MRLIHFAKKVQSLSYALYILNNRFKSANVNYIYVHNKRGLRFCNAIKCYN